MHSKVKHTWQEKGIITRQATHRVLEYIRQTLKPTGGRKSDRELYNSTDVKKEYIKWTGQGYHKPFSYCQNSIEHTLGEIIIEIPSWTFQKHCWKHHFLSVTDLQCTWPERTGAKEAYRTCNCFRYMKICVAL